MSLFSEAAKQTITDKLPYLNERDGDYILVLDKVKNVKGKVNGKEYRIAEFKVVEAAAAVVPSNLLRPGETGAPPTFTPGAKVSLTVDMTSPYAVRDLVGLYASATGMSLEQFTAENKKSAEEAFKKDKAPSLEEAAEKFSLLARIDSEAASEKNKLRGVAIRASVVRTVAGAKSKTPGAIYSNVRFAPAGEETNKPDAVAARRKELGG